MPASGRSHHSKRLAVAASLTLAGLTGPSVHRAAAATDTSGSSTSTAVSTPSPHATSEAGTAKQIQNEIELNVANSKVAVIVKALVKERYAVIATGTVDSDKDLAAAKKAITDTIGTLKKEQGITFVDPDIKGLAAAPAPKVSRLETAKTLSAVAQSYFDPAEATASIVILPQNRYRLKLTGHPSSIKSRDAMIARSREVATDLGASLPPVTAGKAGEAKPEVDAVVDCAGLTVTPESLIAYAFKPVTDAAPGVTVSVLRRSWIVSTPPGAPKNIEVHYAVALAGKVDSLETIHNLERLSAIAIQNANADLATTQIMSLKSGVIEKAATIPPANVALGKAMVTALVTDALVLQDTSVKTDRWPISRLGNAGFADLTTGKSPVDSAVAALKAVFGDSAATRDAQAITLKGSQSDVRRMKSLLALEDSAHPQVRLSFWSVQSSGDLKQVASNLGAITADLQGTQQRVRGLSGVLQNALILSMIANKVENDPFFYRFYGQMFGEQPWEARKELQDLPQALINNLKGLPGNSDPSANKVRDFSTDEALILLGLVQDRTFSQAALRFCGACYRYQWARALTQEFTGSDSTAPSLLAYFEYALKKSKLTPDAAAQIPEETLRREFSLTSDKISTTVADILNDREAAHGIEASTNESLQGFKKMLSASHKDANTRDSFRINWKAQQAEAESPFLETLTATYTQGYAAQSRLTVDDFLKSLHDYYDFVRALGIYTFPQGRYIRQAGKENAPGADDLNEESYYATHYYPDADGVPISENPEVTASDLDHAPETLVSESDKVDGLLESTVDALQADEERIYLTPLLERIRSNEDRRPVNSGISLGARTTIAVSDNQEASQVAKMYSYIQTSAPKPFTADELLGAAEAKDTSSGLAKLISGLPLTQRILVNGAFNSDIEPNFGQIAPGISVKATPSTSLSGSAADLKLDTIFGVPAVTPDASPKADVYDIVHPSGIASDEVTTRVEVDGFRLFNVSSEDTQTTTPQGNTGIPFLSRIPLIGTIFQMPLAPLKIDYQSLLLVNAVIVPKSLRLANFYGAVAARNHPEDPTGTENNPLLSLSKTLDAQTSMMPPSK